jgi:hypothetical protein
VFAARSVPPGQKSKENISVTITPKVWSPALRWSG